MRTFPNLNAGKKQISSGGGVAPLWSKDGQELYYLSNDKNMMVAHLIPGTALNMSEPTRLFHVRNELLVPESRFYTPWDVAKDGRFIMARIVGGLGGQVGTVIVVENWLEELNQKVKQ